MADEPESTDGFNDDLFFTIRQTRYQGSDNILSLKQSASGWIVLDEIGHGHACPFSISRVWTFHLENG
jgi:hypothetical protein